MRLRGLIAGAVFAAATAAGGGGTGAQAAEPENTLYMDLEDGRVVEQGTHDDLVARGGVYARLLERQLLEEELEV